MPLAGHRGLNGGGPYPWLVAAQPDEIAWFLRCREDEGGTSPAALVGALAGVPEWVGGRLG